MNVETIMKRFLDAMNSCIQHPSVNNIRSLDSICGKHGITRTKRFKRHDAAEYTCYGRTFRVFHGKFVTGKTSTLRFIKEIKDI